MTDSYIIKIFRSSEVIKIFFYQDLLSEYNTETKQLFFQVLKGTQINIKKTDGWVPVSWELMKKHWGKDKANWEILVADGLLEVKFLETININGTNISKTYSRSQGLSREFRVCAEVLELIHSIEPKTVAEFENCPFYNLMTGYKMDKVVRHKLTNSTGQSLPKVIKESILSIERCVVNYPGIETYLEEFDASIEDKSYDNPDYKRFKNDHFCYLNILSHPHKKLNDTLLEYYPSYEVQMSGRISEQGGGMQSCTRVMKEVGFAGVPDIKNYDLQSSQVWSLIQFFEVAGLDITWLKDYLVVDKKIYADQVGISVDCWKSCTLTLIMGGSLLSKKQLDKSKFEDLDISIINYLKEELVTEFDTVMAYLKFCEIVEPLKKEIDKWHTWLVEHYVLTCTTVAQGKEYVTNRTGVTFPIWQYRKQKADKKVWVNLNELKRKLAAFYLQGNESCFIHHLTCLSTQFDYEVYGNAHDGLITRGEIPEEAVEIAKELSGLRYAILVEKPFS